MDKQSASSKKESCYIRYLSRTVILWFGQVLGFILIANLSVGLTINSWQTAVVVVTIIGFLNMLFWPILSRLFLPFLVYTVGIGALLLNGLMIWFVSNSHRHNNTGLGTYPNPYRNGFYNNYFSNNYHNRRRCIVLPYGFPKKH